MRPRRLVVDSNVIMAAMIKDSMARGLIIKSGIQLFAPSFVFEEIEAHSEIISRKNRLDTGTNLKILKTLAGYMTVVDKEFYAKRMEHAERIMRGIDEKDAPCLALAMSFENDGIWTEDRDFEKQSAVKVWKTKDLTDIL